MSTTPLIRRTRHDENPTFREFQPDLGEARAVTITGVSQDSGAVVVSTRNEAPTGASSDEP
jgi:hypothetical protein